MGCILLAVSNISHVCYSKLASDGIKRDVTQMLLDTANYTYEKKNGIGIVHDVRNELTRYFAKKKTAAEKLATKVGQLYDLERNLTVPSGTKLADLPDSVYWDSDVPTTLKNKTFVFDS